ncbi:MAG TPA: response regulator transcription factor [Vicinamibacteria bacterium]|nr:response regulator transcription factor [Vicinamibacteria bacterium]
MRGAAARPAGAGLVNRARPRPSSRRDEPKERTNPIRIVVADEQRLFHESVLRFLAAQPGLAIASDCASPAEVLEVLARRPVDVLLLDLDLGTGVASDLLRRARANGFEGAVLLVAAAFHPRQVLTLLDSGIAGITLKRESLASLLQSIREVASGKVALGQDMLSEVLGSIARTSKASAAARLSARERHVVALVRDGLANRDIAGRLDVSEASVKKTLQRVFAKTGVHRRSLLVRLAFDRDHRLV